MNSTNTNALFSKKASTWFRGIAAIMVILSHFAEWWSWFYVEEGISELIRYGISRFGPYGVAIFLLFSGYGLAKTAGEKRIGGLFIAKRVLGVYIPYLVMVILIEVLSGGFETVDDFVQILYGQNFWYMTVMFSLYIAFLCIWLVLSNCHVRALLMTAFTVWYSNYLYRVGEYDFWYISNIAFAIGVLLALYEPFVKKITDKAGIVLAMVFAIGSAGVVYSALFMEHSGTEPIEEIWSRIIAVVIFVMFVVFLASVWKWYDPLLCFFGKYSLYLYLSHTFLFMWAINYFEYEMSVNFCIAGAVILVVSIIIGVIISKVCDLFISKLTKLGKVAV